MSAKITPVIMCGGSGTRLWPLSRESVPKQFIQLSGGLSTLQDTLVRVSHVDFAKPIVITNAVYRFLVAEQLEQLRIEGDIVLEPSRRDSAPAIAAAVALRPGEGVMLVLAADHAVADANGFRRACREGLSAAIDGCIVSFGVVPDKPTSSYGYLRAGAPIDGKVRRLDAFHEKPTEATAKQLIDEGCLWNSGNLLFRADVMRAEIEEHQPQIWQAASTSVDQRTIDLDFTRLGSAFDTSPCLSIDYAVMEKTKRGAVVVMDSGWSDLGTWDSVWDNAQRDADGNALSGPVAVHKVRNSLVNSASPIFTTVVGLDDVVVVTTADAVLVAPRAVSDDLKMLLEMLRRQGRPEFDTHRRIHRPWGYHEQVDFGERHLVNRIVVKPGQSLSLQKHDYRSEHWVVVKGTAEVTIDGTTTLLAENESTYIPTGRIHRLANPGAIPLEIIEVQVGSRLSEDDIVRLEQASGGADGSN